ncbi:MAG: endonuclease/exonuclease/phosphatase [Chitinophagaceae bacterium]
MSYKHLFFLCISVFFIHVSSTAQKKPSYAIGFYNLENYYDTLNDPNINDDEFTPNGANAYTPAVFEKKVANLVSVISKMGKDQSDIGLAILGVAEIENRDVLQVLCNQEPLKSLHWKVVHFDGPDVRGIDCGLLYNSDVFKVLSASSLTVPVEEGDRPTRDVLYVYGKLANDPIHIFVNHWPSRRGGEAATREKRKIAAGVSKHIIDSLMAIDPMTKVVVMGDLNDDPINESVTKILASKWKKEEVKPGGLYNPWTSFYRKGLGTIAYQDTWGLFDQIIISYGFLKKNTTGLHYQEAEVFSKSFMVEKFGQYKGYPKRSYSNGKWNDGYSDHYPTLIFLQ